MASEQQDLQQIMAHVERLSPQDRLRLIQRVAETLLPAERRRRPRRLVYGRFQGRRTSTDKDFSIAE